MVYIIYLDSARLVSFEIELISKEVSRAEHEYTNIHPPPPPPISVLATALSKQSKHALRSRIQNEQGNIYILTYTP